MKQLYIHSGIAHAISANVKTLFLILFLLFSINGFTQTTIFSENFEGASGSQNPIDGGYLGWDNIEFGGSDDNKWWVLNNTYSAIIGGNYSMAISQNTPTTASPRPQYNNNDQENIASSPLINATGYNAITLDFRWICQGETGYDYGQIAYSLDGTNWTIFANSGAYVGQNTTQTITNLDISEVDGQQFYLGFYWQNDGSVRNYPSFIVDDIVVKGTAAVACSQPTAQATGLTFGSVTANTIAGSFSAASPAPDNYLILMNTSGTTPSPGPVDGNTYAVGNTVSGATVVDNDGNTNFNATGLAASTTYYFFIYSFNSACSGGPDYLTSSPLTGNQATSAVTYCTPSVGSGNQSSSYLQEVSFVGTLNNTTNTSTYSNSPRGYQDFTGLTDVSQQAQGEGVNIYVEFEGATNMHIKAWVDWDRNGVFGNTAAEEIYNPGSSAVINTTFGFIIPSGQALGNYRVRIRGSAYGGTSTFGPCGNLNYNGETEDYLFEVVPNCTNIITDIANGEACGSNQTVDLEFEGSAGVTSFRVYANKTGGSPLSPAPTFSTPGGTPTGNWTTPSISTTTSYWVTAVNGCESLARKEIVAKINPVATLTFTPNTPTLCGEDTIVEIAASGDKESIILLDEDFEGTGLSTFTQVQPNVTDARTEWTQRANTYIPVGRTWYPAIASGLGVNHFVMSNSDFYTGVGINLDNDLRSPTVTTTDFLNLFLEFDMYYSDYYEVTNGDGAVDDDYVRIRVSVDGGAWTQVEQYDDADIGVGTDFETKTVDLSAHVGPSFNTIRVSFYYHSEGWTDGVAIDNIKIYGEKPLDSAFDWTTTADAYSDAAATIPYISGTSAPLATIYVKPTPAQLENQNFSFTASAILNNGCSVSTVVPINNKTKYFKGTNNNWNDPDNWFPNGVPSSDNCVIIPDTYRSIINGTTDGDARNVTVKNGGELFIQPNGTLTIVNFSDIRTGGLFEIESGGSLIQIDPVINTGIGDVKRNSANVRDTDYIYWTSPVDAFDLSGISSGTPYYYRWQWIPTVGSNTNGFGDWTYASGNMTLGKGYIVRAGTNNSDSTADTPVNTTFRGVFNNGNINTPIASGTYNGGDYTGPSATLVTRNDDNWNLIGNPYPSAIDAIAFLSANPNIEGAVHIWTHGTQINTTNLPPFYEDYEYSYNVNDYVTYNSSGSSSGAGTYGGNIASGQGFFVMMNHGAADADVNFNNTMRHKSYDNGEFYRTTQTRTENEIERHRIWLSIISPTNQTATSLIGYIEGATLAKDRMFDAYGLENNAMNLFSLIDEDRMLIQGRPLPFNTEDQVPIGAVIPVAGNYTIAIHSVDGLFEDESQDIFLEDLELNIIHNLRNQPYSFNAETGVLDNRFVLRYNNSILSTEEFNDIKDLSITAPKNNYIKITSAKDVIKDVVVYDVLGRVIIDNKNILKSEMIFNEIKNPSGAYIVKVTLANGLQKTQKIILK
ncbi:GEVED domain-containing protein [Xanthomarina sp. GH4-25]|uniref:GEVED domain-containing protein n=1 Tax=Xanthomarina sp. GH4-25 TaxID=3349335 RepID=UPI0038780C59